MTCNCNQQELELLPEIEALLEPNALLMTDEPLQPEVILPTDTRRCVTRTSVAPFRYICNLVYDGAPRCSGTLIGPRTVLTAGHCLRDRPTASFRVPSRMEVVPGRFGTRKPPFGSSRAIRFVPSPDYVPVTRDASPVDYGVIVLSDPIGNRAGWWTFDPMRWPGDTVGTSVLQSPSSFGAAGATVHVCGYPGDLPKLVQLGGHRDACFDPQQNPTGTVQYRDTNRALRVTPMQILESLNDTAGGMSGSPVWVERASAVGGRVLVAVHISGDGSDEFSDKANRGVFIQGPVLDFIRAHSFYPTGSTPPGRPQVRNGSRGGTVRELQYRLNIWIAITRARPGWHRWRSTEFSAAKR